MKRILAALLMLFVLGTASGCEQILEREYRSSQEHYEQYVQEEDSSALVVRNYSGLRNAILHFIEQGDEKGVIRVYDYSGDVSHDLTEVCLYIQQDVPLGAYAVDYISHEKISIMSYTELNVYITYKRPYREIQEIVNVSPQDFYQKLVEKMDECKDLMAFNISSTGFTEQYVYGLVKNAAEELCFPVPVDYTVEFYPESGVQHIVEIKIDYAADRDEFVHMRSRLASMVDFALNSCDAETDAEAYEQIKDLVLSNVDFDERLQQRYSEGADFELDLTDTTYGALINGKAISVGYAEAYLTVCRRAGLECDIVYGTRQSQKWAWNKITIDGKAYIVDTAAADAFDAVWLIDEEEDGAKIYIENQE